MEYFYISLDDDVQKILLDTLSWLKTLRFSNQSDKENRIMRTQCTTVINHVQSGSNQYTLKKLEMIFTALQTAHRTFQSDADAYQAFAHDFRISESQRAYIQSLSAVYRSIAAYLRSLGFDTLQPDL